MKVVLTIENIKAGGTTNRLEGLSCDDCGKQFNEGETVYLVEANDPEYFTFNHGFVHSQCAEANEATYDRANTPHL